MNIGQFSCSLCNLNFKFQSKLDRHLASADHRMFKDSLQSMEDADVDMEDVNYSCAGSDVKGHLWTTCLIVAMFRVRILTIQVQPHDNVVFVHLVFQ